MITLYIVALLTCTATAPCVVTPLIGEVYYTQEDCNKRAQHLTDINPGKEFSCGTVLRRLPQ